MNLVRSVWEVRGALWSQYVLLGRSPALFFHHESGDVSFFSAVVEACIHS